MKKLSVLIALLAAFLAGAARADGTTPSDSAMSDCADIRGVWRIESMDVGYGERARTTTPEAFMFFFAERHYSAIRDLATPSDENPAPDRAFMADAGTYEFADGDLVVHHMVAGFPALGSMTFTCSMPDDDTLVLEPQYDKMVMPGLDLKPSADGKMGYGDVATRYVFSRLE